MHIQTNFNTGFVMKVHTFDLFKITISILVIASLTLLNILYEEKKRNTDLYGQVLSMHEYMKDVTVERQVCVNRVGREEMIIVDRVRYLLLDGAQLIDQ